ncbi:c-type cytochrome [Modicisalibacter luteus]|uniref:C-type cytochrome n=1 Tax=Modicisalibacter luteus TaxID=453962 RepID=A0ABV7M3Y5_9GAMM|nr:cytochrome c [Halomonas lutea]GHA88117.1 hypothetical protein GCM10007159_06910 [Halomonas lutea]
MRISSVIGVIMLSSLTVGSAIAADSSHLEGATLYQQNCAACHQANGEGVPGVYPPLGSRLAAWSEIDSGRHYLANVIRHGMMGSITVSQQTYSGVMPPWARFDNAQLASLLNYITETLPGDPNLDIEEFSAEEVARLTEKSVTPLQVHSLREEALTQLKKL